tara:strand:+ start:97 stop:231 length:135 start_codon:yes stop_codon:yes gene_type:complete
MNKPSEAVGKRMREDLENAYMEIFPVLGIEERLGAPTIQFGAII